MLRQRDVKQQWGVYLNQQRLGFLVRDENDLVACFQIPAGLLRPEGNSLLIAPEGEFDDDVLIGPLWLEHRPLQEVLGEARLEVSVLEAFLSRSPLQGAAGLRTIPPFRRRLVKAGPQKLYLWASAFRR